MSKTSPSGNAERRLVEEGARKRENDEASLFTRTRFAGS